MSSIDRRTLLKLVGLIGATAAMPFSLARAADRPLVVGFIYVGARDDFGTTLATTRRTPRRPPSSRRCRMWW